MKKYFYSLPIVLALFACSDDSIDGVHTDIEPYFDVNELYQEYSLYWKPSDGWVGDPMPMYANGAYQVFYLHDARDGAPTYHPIYHASTTDFLTYTDNGEAIPTGEDGSQEDALGTGSFIEKDGIYYGFYTAHNDRGNPKEKIYLATSTDLKTWTKQTDFSLQAADGYDADEFRDPFVYKDGSVYRMLVTTRGYVAAVNDWQAVIANYTSADLQKWEIQEPYYYNGERILECPDVFAIGNYEYLVYSNWDWANANRRVLYRYRQSGSAEWEVPDNDVLDGYAFYAGKTASDGNKRYLFGWTATRENHSDANNYNWAGNLVVHQLLQNTDGTLRVTVPETIVAGIGNSVSLKTSTLANTTVSDSNTFTMNASGGTAIATFDKLKGIHRIEANINPGSATQFGFDFGLGGIRSKKISILLDISAKTITCNAVDNGTVTAVLNTATLPTADSYDVTIVIENSVCVVYLNGTTAFSNRIYSMNQNAWGIRTLDGQATFKLNLYKK
ncbi:MAG: glycoside hydrolase family 32 protein [Capnocytophaga sp.]|nr:glycoside hydrolase family 32 protein [Capnocytophaga sp.]